MASLPNFYNRGLQDLAILMYKMKNEISSEHILLSKFKDQILIAIYVTISLTSVFHDITP